MSAIILTEINLTVKPILEWGRAKPTAHTVAALGEFSQSDTESLRRLLRKECLNGNPAVLGEWRKGYEMAIGNERVGVTNARGSFKIYYRRSTLNGYGRATGAIPQSWYTVNTADYTARVDRETGEVSYE